MILSLNVTTAVSMHYMHQDQKQQLKIDAALIATIEQKYHNPITIDWLLSACNADPNAKNTHGIPVLLLAIQQEQLGTVQLLVTQKADINSQESTAPLMQSCYQGNQEITKTLLMAKANANITTKYGHTALMDAALNGDISIIVLLLEHGANPYAHNKERKTAYDFLTPEHENTAAIIALLDQYKIKTARTQNQELTV